jgi:hypothetical protein
MADREAEDSLTSDASAVMQRERERQRALIESLRNANTPDELARVAERAV